jgi:hypothetical protein
MYIYSGLVETHISKLGPSWPWSYGSWIYNYLCNRCLSPLMLWVRLPLRARSTTLSNKVCQWLAAGRWFSPGPSVSSINKTDRHDIAAILLKVALNTITQPTNQPQQQRIKRPWNITYSSHTTECKQKLWQESL